MNKVKKQPSVLLCILMDLIGCATYLLPGVGEFFDIIWAPVSAIIFYKLFGGWKGTVGGIFNFIEEIFPGLDFIPSFTIMWIIRRVSEKQNSAMIQPI